MASEQPLSAGVASSLQRPDEDVARDGTPSFWADPLRLLGWGVTLLALGAYWFLFVRRPPPAPGQPIARLTAVEGVVRLKANAGEAWTRARLAEQLHVGDVLQTEARAGAVISFDSGSVVRVRPESIVYVGGSAESSTAAWRVSSGRVNFSVGEGAAEILTASARTRAAPFAAGQLDVGDGGTGLKVFSGRAELRTQSGQTIALSANEAVQVDASGQAGPLHSLPPPPTLLAPASRSELPFVAPPAALVTLSWTPAPGAASYTVAMDYNVTQADLLLSAALEVPGIASTSHGLSGVDPGRYFWRVAGVTRDGLEGAFSRVSLFSVLRPEPQRSAASPPPLPALVLEQADEISPGVVHISGRADSSAALTVNGAAIPVLPDGTFSEYLRLPSGSEVVVRSTARDGRVSQRTRRVRGR
jgi:hypothetical protein